MHAATILSSKFPPLRKQPPSRLERTPRICGMHAARVNGDGWHSLTERYPAPRPQTFRSRADETKLLSCWMTCMQKNSHGRNSKPTHRSHTVPSCQRLPTYLPLSFIMPPLKASSLVELTASALPMHACKFRLTTINAKNPASPGRSVPRSRLASPAAGGLERSSNQKPGSAPPEMLPTRIRLILRSWVMRGPVQRDRRLGR